MQREIFLQERIVLQHGNGRVVGSVLRGVTPVAGLPGHQGVGDRRDHAVAAQQALLGETETYDGERALQDLTRRVRVDTCRIGGRLDRMIGG